MSDSMRSADPRRRPTHWARLILAGLAGLATASILIVLLFIASTFGSGKAYPSAAIVGFFIVGAIAKELLVPAAILLVPVWGLLHWRGAGLATFAIAGAVFAPAVVGVAAFWVIHVSMDAMPLFGASVVVTHWLGGLSARAILDGLALSGVGAASAALMWWIAYGETSPRP